MKAKHDVVTARKGSDGEIDRAIEELIALRKGSRLDGVSWKALRDAGRR
ncbi:hypothetical protein [Candidatus Palauibacter sp.]